MTTQIYIIRHGESEGNRLRKFLGHSDLDITDLGHIQAENTAEFLYDIPVDVIYSSDLLRAYNTALHTAEKKGMDVIKSVKLREIFAGEWENRFFSDIEENCKESFGRWQSNIGRSRCDGGESTEELQNRVTAEIKRIARENEGKTVFVFTHATVLRVFKAFADGKTLDEIKDVPWATNASVSHFEYSDGKFTCIEYSIDSFQGENKTKVPANV